MGDAAQQGQLAHDAAVPRCLGGGGEQAMGKQPQSVRTMDRGNKTRTSLFFSASVMDSTSLARLGDAPSQREARGIRLVCRRSFWDSIYVGAIK